MSTNLDEIVQQQQVKIHDLEKELEKALTEAPTPEAVYSLTAEKPVLNKFGTTWKPTFRSRQGEAFNRYMHRIDSAMAAFFEDKWQPVNGGDGNIIKQVRIETDTDLDAAFKKGTVVSASPAPGPTNGGTNGGSAQEFPGKLLACTVTDGKAFWKVKGGRFERYGVAVYPEVLGPAGFKNLDPLTTYDLNGWTAQYALKEDGKPSKVTKLYKAT